MKNVINYLSAYFTYTCLLALCMISFALPSSAQFKLRLIVTNNATLHKADPVFVAGNFNDWNPGDTSYQLKQENNQFLFELQNLNSSVYEFKFTRGGWGKEACNLFGNSLGNIVLQLSSDSTVYLTIEAWKDDFPLKEKKHTALFNVRLVDTAFYIPQLNRSRKVMIYLPDGYEKSLKHYPVLYMHDGQNLFDEFTAGYGEWGVDECLDSLIKKGKKACIVIAIDNGPKRLNEYNPFYFEKFGKGEGEAYLNFIVETLKPFIDKNYRTLKNKENTIIAGSSMGGLISYYAFLKYPNVFGKAGIFSPAFWTADGIKQMTDSLGENREGMLFFYMGGLEGEKYITDMFKVCESIAKNSHSFIYTVIDEKGQHNEQAWRKWFAEFYLWITADGNNYIIKTSD